MTAHVLGVVPAVAFMVVFVVFANTLLTRTAFGRWIYAVGNSVRAARLSGLPVDRTIIGVYLLGGMCSALAGIMLVGFNGQAFNGMGDPYLLPSIAVVVVGGTTITGGRGHYFGILGGALLLTAVDILLVGQHLAAGGPRDRVRLRHSRRRVSLTGETHMNGSSRLLNGSRVIVTAGAAGIGRAIVDTFVAHGAKRRHV